MINLTISILTALLLIAGLWLGLQVHLALSIPLGLIVGVVIFLILGRRVQTEIEKLMTAMQRDIQAGKLDRGIETLKRGYAFRHRHLFITSQLNSQIGMLYYLKKDHDNALGYLKDGFLRHYVAQCMLAAIYYKRKDYDAMKKTMDATIQANKKESFCYAMYAYLLSQLKERDAAIDILQKGLKRQPEDQKLITNLNLLQNNKRMKMKIYGDLWVQFMLERAPRMQQQLPPHMRQGKRALFR